MIMIKQNTVSIKNNWFYQDSQCFSIEDRNMLCGFLQKHNIPVEGHFQDALTDNNGAAWRYPAFAVKYYSSDPCLVEKLRLLCQRRREGDNDVERNFQNQLVEFHALYACVALMGYQFDGWDKPSGKIGADPQKDCDLVFMKDEQKVFADAKDVSSEILSQYEVEGSPDLKMYALKIELTAWLKSQVSNGKRKGADLLICHTPGWELARFGFNERGLPGWLDTILPKTMIWFEEGPVWQIDSGCVSQIIIIKREGCLKIRVEKA